MDSFGYIEVIGLVTAVAAADAALKAANVQIVRKENPGAGMITVLIRGEIGAVRAAVEAASEVAQRIGKLTSCNIIARPDAALDPTTQA